MAINADTLLERLYLKSQLTRWRILAVIFAVVALVVGLERHSVNSPIEKDYVARLSFDGIIDDDRKIYNLIDEISNNRKIKAVVVWLDTPGGSAVGGEEIYLHLRHLSEKKPVVAVMRSVAASAGYLVALGTDHIIARDGTITGSIGVLIETAEITELAAKIGIKPVIIKSSPLKGTPSPFEKDTAESDRAVRDVINDFYVRFVDIVAERRHLSHETALTLADGRVYGGKRAVEDKLIDGIGGEPEAMKWLVTEKHIEEGLDIKDVKFEQEKGLFDQLTQGVAGKFFENSSVTLDGLVAMWHPRLQ
jgi:protease-4